MNTQLLLNVKLRDDATFGNFYSGENKQLVSRLQSVLNDQEKFIYAWGQQGSGKTHLLQACCHLAQENNLPTIYLSLKELHTPALLENIENLSLVCLDDLDAIAGNSAWEEAVFHCYNRVLQTSAKIIFAAAIPPKHLPLQLPDLLSRLCASVIYQIHALSDDEKIAALQLRATMRGMNLSRQAAEFLLHHYQRNNKILFDILEQLDQATLTAKRKLTIPFIKTILNFL